MSVAIGGDPSDSLNFQCQLRAIEVEPNTIQNIAPKEDKRLILTQSNSYQELR